MQLTYNESRAICIQDPNAMGTPSGQDPFRSSFRAAAALAQAPAQAPPPVRPTCLPCLHPILACDLQNGLHLDSQLMQQCCVGGRMLCMACTGRNNLAAGCHGRWAANRRHSCTAVLNIVSGTLNECELRHMRCMGCRLAPSAGGFHWWLPWALRCWRALLHAPSSRSGGGGGDATSASLALDRCEAPNGATHAALNVSRS